MDRTQTLAALAIAISCIVLAGIKERKPYQPGRMWGIPWKAVLALSLLATLILLAHLIGELSGHVIPARGGF